MDEIITLESLAILQRRLQELHTVAAEIREWGRLRGVYDVHDAAVQAEDSVMLAVQRQIPRKRNLMIDDVLNRWTREREKLRADGGDSEAPPANKKRRGFRNGSDN
jgi:hypothetical protein